MQGILDAPPSRGMTGKGGTHVIARRRSPHGAAAGAARRIKQRSETRDGMRIDWDVPITMDDGLVLRADVFRPVAEGRYPVILSYGPYAKGLAFQDGYPSAWQRMAEKHPDVTAGSSNLYQSWEVVDPEKWVPHDYACVRVDSRGCGCRRASSIISRRARPRISTTASNGPACSRGRTARSGSTAFPITASISGTSRRCEPPHLAAMCIWEGAADWYRDMTHHGGILCTFWENWYDMQVKTVQYGAGERGKRSRVHGELVCGPEFLSDAELAKNRSDFGADIVAHPLDDEYHRARSPVWSKVKVPFLSAANWGGQPLHPRGNFEGFVRAASKHKWLEVHGIEHWTHFYTDYGRDLQLRFFDYFLHGKKNGWDRAAAGAASGAPRRSLRRARGAGMAAQAHQVDEVLSRSGRRRARRQAAKKKIGAQIRSDGRRRHLCHAAAGAGDRNHRPVGGEARCLVLDRRRRHFRRAARLLARPQGSGVPGRHRSAHAGRPGLAARLAPRARQKTVEAVPALSHAIPRSSRSNPARWSRSTSKSGRPRSSCRPATASR